eukprot:TRINITY_DN104301_c0_g1_i1.p1 TRINITY_DN104301_c0_g1~~TRINITY_DN104301_c0_g1_i1.p1  ORF type:complete len:441 (+),score=93.41 TRINITY_DN104301_c0_g1_i1:43-1365(+)
MEITTKRTETESEELLLKAEELLLKGLEIHKKVFFDTQKEKDDELKSYVDKIVEILGDIRRFPHAEMTSKALCIIGRAYNCCSKEYNKEASKCLLKSAKYKRTSENLCGLGLSYWKSGDLKGAQFSFETALKMDDEKELLRNLSMLIRQMEQKDETKEDKEKRFSKSIDLAKRAIMKDFQDGESWYILGNAHTGYFFNIDHSWRSLQQALTAYKKAKPLCPWNPDLFLNCGNVLKFVQNYNGAFEDYEMAAKLDKELMKNFEEPYKQELINIRELAESIKSNVGMKPKHITGVRASLRAVKLPKGYEHVSIQELRVDPSIGNKGCLSLRPLVKLQRTEPPVMYICMDPMGSCVALSLYHFDNETQKKVNERDVIQILQPAVQSVDTNLNRNLFHKEEDKSMEADVISFECIRVTDPNQCLVNGKVVNTAYHHSTMKTSVF